MTPDEQELADAVYAAIQDSSSKSERAQQDDAFQVGVSALGWCSERTRRMIVGIPEPPTDKLAAFVGTALGDHVEQAVLERLWPHAVLQAEVVVTLTGDGGTYKLPGHPDIVLPEGIVIDMKSARGLESVRRNGPDQQQQFQRHLYALGAWEMGLFGTLDLDQVQVANVWIDRAADEKGLHVHMEPFSQAVVEQATVWLDDVVYAVKFGGEARKEPPRQMCFVACGHAPDCRGGDTDVQGLITDIETVGAVGMYREAVEMERAAARLKDQAKAALVGVTGSTGKFSVRWIKVGGGHVSYERAASERLDIREIK